MPSPVESLVRLLSSAHRTGHLAPVAQLDALNTATVSEGYAAQAGVVIALGERVAGWKVGFGPDKLPAAAPLLGGVVARQGATVALPPDRPFILEIEIAFRLARDLPPRPGRPYTPSEIEDAIDVALAGAELIAARGGMPAAGTPFPRFIADLQGNAGYVCGSETRGFRSIDLKACRVSLWIDDERVHDAVGGHPQGDPYLPLVAWANAQCDRLGGLRTGQIVTTGTLTPPRAVDHRGHERRQGPHAQFAPRFGRRFRRLFQRRPRHFLVYLAHNVFLSSLPHVLVPGQGKPHRVYPHLRQLLRRFATYVGANPYQARALLKAAPDCEPGLRDLGLLTRDARMKERKKYGQKGARKRFQYSKR